MESLTKYDIEIFSLKEKEYQYNFYSKNDFFDLFKNDIVEKGEFNTSLTLLKSATMLQLLFDIEGVLKLICDRSLDEFDYPFQTEQRQILKFGEYYEEQSEDLEIIPWKTTKINIAKYIYEFVLLSVPAKKLHPRFLEEESEEESFLVYSSKEITESENSNENEDLQQSLSKLREKWNKKKQN